MIREIKGDLFEHAGTHVLVHQCNLVSPTVAGLARVMFMQYPEADDRQGENWSHRWKKHKLHIAACATPSNDVQLIANIYGQLHPGRPWPAGSPDSAWERLCVFKEAFEELCGKVDHIALPKNIGCGLAGGDWKNYRHVIDIASIKYPRVNILIIKQE